MPDNDSPLQKPDNNHEPELITRFSIALMAFTLMGMGVGTALPRQLGVLTLCTGMVGLISFGIFETTARKRRRDVVDSLRTRHEDRLSQQLRGMVSKPSEQPQEELAIAE